MANRYDFSMPLDYGGFRDNSSSIANRYNPFWDAEANISLNDIVKGNIASNASNDLQSRNYQVVPHAVSETPSYVPTNESIYNGVLGDSIADAKLIKNADGTYTSDHPLVAKIIQKESGGRADAKSKYSSASGLFQFIDSTWNNNKYAGDRFNAEDSLRAFKALTASNIRQMKSLGIPINERNIYLAHQQGVGGLKKILDAQMYGTEVSDKMARNMKGNMHTPYTGVDSFLNYWDRQFGG